MAMEQKLPVDRRAMRGGSSRRTADEATLNERRRRELYSLVQEIRDFHWTGKRGYRKPRLIETVWKFRDRASPRFIVAVVTYQIEAGVPETRLVGWSASED